MAINVITAPTEYPVSVADVKGNLNIDHDQDDAMLASRIAEITEEAQTLAARSFVTRTVEALFDEWPADGTFLLPYPPVQSVTSVTYYDENNAEQTVAASVYYTVLDTVPPMVRLKPGQSWPSDSLRDVSPIRVRYVAGYGAAGSVPPRYRNIIATLVAVDYESREAIGTTAMAQRERLQAALRLDWGWA